MFRGSRNSQKGEGLHRVRLDIEVFMEVAWNVKYRGKRYIARLKVEIFSKISTRTGN